MGFTLKLLLFFRELIPLLNSISITQTSKRNLYNYFF